MNFAVIEYTTKTGMVWKHTAERPNYLGDPQREIDPTSFACYTSALEGEHIPLVGLITGGVVPVSPWQRLVRKAYKKVTGSWPQNYSLDYLKPFDVLLVVYQISDGHEITAFTKRLKQVYPQTMVLGVPTQPYGLLRQDWETHPEHQQDFKDFMNSCDRFVTIVASTAPFWEQLTTKPVLYLPQPYPVDYTRQFFVPLERKEPVIFVAGNTERPHIRQGQLVARQLQQEFPAYTIHVTQIPGVELDTTNLQGTRYQVTPFEEWREHLESLGKTRLIINTDYTFTRGRVQADGAAVGTPSIGANSDGQEDLFPDLPATATTSVEELVKHGRRLLTDAAFYQQVTATARERLQKYNYAQAARRITALLTSHG